MGLITKEVEIEISNYNYKHYDKIPKISDNKRTKKVGGYHWVYFEDFKKMSKEEIKKLIS